MKQQWPSNRPLTRLQLDGGVCEVPGCDHKDHSVLYLNQKCHIGAGLNVRYHKVLGILSVICRRCEKPVAEIKVADD